MKKISVVIPAYNEEEIIETTCLRVIQVLDENKYESREIIIVNDGSRDRTHPILKELSESHPDLKVLSFSRNFGHEAATTAGLKYASGDYIFIIDADLQDPPELFPDMIKLMEKSEADLVYGVRKSRKGESGLKKLTSKMFYRAFNLLSDYKFPLDTGDFRLLNRKVLDEFNALKEKKKYVRGLFSWIGFKQIPITYERAPREGGVSKYNYKNLMRLAMDVIFSFSKKPLKIASGVGLFCIFFSLIFLIYILISKAVYAVPGWASITTLIVFFGGVQMFTIGVLGEYLGIIFDEIKGRPEYIVAETLNAEDTIKNNEKSRS
ncbi:MAG: glycosyltransferase family 2 protein [Spirochaetales bacterium]|nr:glycosyltransferase family 2 protein [Spirochaetales bacterium]